MRAVIILAILAIMLIDLSLSASVAKRKPSSKKLRKGTKVNKPVAIAKRETKCEEVFII